MNQDAYMEIPSLPYQPKHVIDIAEEARYSGIKEILGRWGIWAREQPRIGYPKKSAGMEQNPNTESIDPCSDDDAKVIEVPMLNLMKNNPDEYDVLFARYVVGASVPKIAAYLSESKSTIEKRLAKGEFYVAGVLHGMESIFIA